MRCGWLESHHAHPGAASRYHRLLRKPLTALKRLALPPELLAARPKRLRFLIFQTAGLLLRHARKLILRLAAAAARLAVWREALRLLPLPS